MIIHSRLLNNLWHKLHRLIRRDFGKIALFILDRDCEIFNFIVLGTQFTAIFFMMLLHRGRGKILRTIFQNRIIIRDIVVILIILIDLVDSM